MDNKLYKCQICDRDVVIRTKIKNKDSEYFGKSACPICASKYNIQKEKKQYRINPRTEKNNHKRREDRKDYSDFFKKHIDIIKNNDAHCEECNEKLIGDVSEIAHLVKKSSNGEVATNDLNVVYLCGKFSKNQCHSNFDSNFEKRNKMNVFKIALGRFEQFRDEIINITNEVLNYEENLI